MPTTPSPYKHQTQCPLMHPSNQPHPTHHSDHNHCPTTQASDWLAQPHAHNTGVYKHHTVLQGGVRAQCCQGSHHPQLRGEGPRQVVVVEPPARAPHSINHTLHCVQVHYRCGGCIPTSDNPSSAKLRTTPVSLSMDYQPNSLPKNNH